jgi:sulfatase modifying factor 1
VEGGGFDLTSIVLKNKETLKIWVDSFLMAELPVTQGLYESLTGTNTSHFKGEKRPVDSITWFEAVDFCNLLNAKIGINNSNAESKLLPNDKIEENFNDFKGFRLPTEAEWVYAAMGGVLRNDKEYYQFAGSNSANRVAWYEGNSGYETKPAGLKFPNQLGLYDMSGNVFEWCWDWYQAGFFDNASEKNPVNYKIGEGRVLRGGSALGSKETCRIIQRNNDAPDGKWRNAGFRLIFSF